MTEKQDLILDALTSMVKASKMVEKTKDTYKRAMELEVDEIGNQEGPWPVSMEALKTMEEALAWFIETNVALQKAMNS